jgi:hypothetical protein
VRTIFNAAVAAIVAIALYFALVWGYDGLRILTSPSYGLEDVWRFVFAIGRLFSLGPIGLIKLAAFFGALKIAVACICGYSHCRPIPLHDAWTAKFPNP